MISIEKKEKNFRKKWESNRYKQCSKILRKKLKSDFYLHMFISPLVSRF